jgi:Flp pilus assembly protein TadD
VHRTKAKSQRTILRDGHIEGREKVNDISALLAEARTHHGAGRLQDAERSYRQALTLEPEIPEAQNNLGSLYLQLGRLEDAQEAFGRALGSRPDFPEAQFNLGLAFKRSGRFEAAGASFRRALSLRPELPEAHHELGNVCRLLGKMEEAEACHRRALELRANFAEADHGLALVLVIGGRLQEAEFHLRRAIAIRPNLPGAHCNLGWVLAERGNLDEAELNYRAALELDPADRTAAYNLSQVRLLLGDLETGLELFEHRIEGGSAVHFGETRELLKQLDVLPRWRGEPLQGRGILLWTEQGLGDTLMMMRYLARLKRLGASRIDVICPQELVRLMQASPEVDHAAPGGAVAVGRLSYHCSFMSLPYLFGTRLETIPCEIPYLHVPPELDRLAAERLAAVARPRCGLAWAGSAKNARDRTRSLGLAQLAALLEVERVRFVSLQKGAAASEIAPAGAPIGDWMAQCEDFLDTAALVRQLDLVVSVDTAVAHLAGALGKPVWLLNRYESEWRWLLERSDSPWYPTMRIFRQRSRGDWAGVVREVEAALRELA